MEVYIVRHGETVWNKKELLQGFSDIELTEYGRELARKLGDELKDIEFDMVFSSPLIRAYETASLILGDKNVQIDRDDRLKEMCFGSYEGQSYKVWQAPDSDYRYFFTEPDKFIAPSDGESIEDICNRTREFLLEKVEPNHDKYKRIMIVAHGALNKALMCHIENNDIAHFWGDGLQKNCEATVFDFDGETWRKIG